MTSEVKGSRSPIAATSTLRELVTRSPEETEAAGARLARHLRRGHLLLLSGPLGAGKTTFVRGLARGLGVTGEVQSPTFQLVRLHRGDIPLAHLDVHRLPEGALLSDLGLEDLLDEGAAVVEWGDRLPAGAATGTVSIEVLGIHHRRISIDAGPTEWSL